MTLIVGTMTIVRSEDYTWYNPFHRSSRLRIPVVEGAVLDLLKLSEHDTVPERQSSLRDF